MPPLSPRHSRAGCYVIEPCNGQDLDQAAERKIELTRSGLGLDQCFARVRASGSALAAISAAFLMVNPAD